MPASTVAIATTAVATPQALPVAGPLSPRELEVLALVADGYRDHEIAARLFVSPHTVANHVKRILEKLETPSRAAAVARALRAGWL
jgi:DNA-binding NarL/FixJ family response regulator